MIKTLDFNALEKPVLELTLKDKDRTVVRATAPTEELVERLMAASEGIKKVINENKGESIHELFKLVAELMSCNLDDISFTAEDLRDRYNLRLYDVTVFVKVYLEFIQELNNAKN